MTNEAELLKSICDVAVLSIMDLCEWKTHPKFREIKDWELELREYCLWHTGLWCSSKRKRIAMKLEHLNTIEFSSDRKGSPICVRFKNKDYVKLIHEKCIDAVSDFDYMSGVGFNSYPQYTKTDKGKHEVELISKLIFDKIVSDFNLSI